MGSIVAELAADSPANCVIAQVLIGSTIVKREPPSTIDRRVIHPPLILVKFYEVEHQDIVSSLLILELKSSIQLPNSLCWPTSTQGRAFTFKFLKPAACSRNSEFQSMGV